MPDIRTLTDSGLAIHTRPTTVARRKSKAGRLPDLLRRLLEERGLAPLDVARLTHHSKGTIYRHLSGEVVPSTSFLETYAQILGVSSEELMEAMKPAPQLRPRVEAMACELNDFDDEDLDHVLQAIRYIQKARTPRRPTVEAIHQPSDLAEVTGA